MLDNLNNEIGATYDKAKATRKKLEKDNTELKKQPESAESAVAESSKKLDEENKGFELPLYDFDGAPRNGFYFLGE